ncbi:MAG: metal-sensitive transcriptional regulator [Candidatus Magasanikbacteria bacterium]|jgi:CsoR family transcriptional regulator, copper-sensing transcriptional repressor|nr:metal-sensitive transcriptional regulator [Candidatus Magasanikbacteria bacterium]MBT4071991.1 metal-sensitive transcriptional regulator [Candidatus Magasanikbacteria bacterium]
MKNIQKRLNKVIGQISGINKMIEEKQDCEKIIVQFQAAKAALESAFSESLSKNLEKCIQKKDSKNIKNILKLISKK